MSMLFGIMQGRLTPQFRYQYQAHPVNHWQSEFFIAKQLNLQLIEFIIDSASLETNPLLTHHGIQDIKAITQASGIGVKTICADAFMDIPFHKDTSRLACNLLETLLSSGSQLGITDIVIPCVDRFSLHSAHEHIDWFCQYLSPFLDRAGDLGIKINLETDLPPEPFNTLLDKLGRSKVWVNYDIGNSASLGFDAVEEFEHYGDRISNIHIKDRPQNGFSVPLGTGDADFDLIIKLIKNYNCPGPLIFQAARKNDFIDDLVNIRTQINWFIQRWGNA